jgi:hypothetical protein
LDKALVHSHAVGEVYELFEVEQAPQLAREKSTQVMKTASVQFITFIDIAASFIVLHCCLLYPLCYRGNFFLPLFIRFSRMKFEEEKNFT